MPPARLPSAWLSPLVSWDVLEGDENEAHGVGVIGDGEVQMASGAPTTMSMALGPRLDGVDRLAHIPFASRAMVGPIDGPVVGQY